LKHAGIGLGSSAPAFDHLSGAAGQPLNLVPAENPSASGHDLEKTLKEADKAAALAEKWIRCTQEVSRKLALESNEPAETIILATFGNCSQLEEVYFSQLLKGGMSVRQADGLKTYTRQAAREHIAADILGLRAAPSSIPTPR
jgi:hypothetical protein